MRTKHLTAAQVVEFRDKAWNRYFLRTEYLEKIERKFGYSRERILKIWQRLNLSGNCLEIKIQHWRNKDDGNRTQSELALDEKQHYSIRF